MVLSFQNLVFIDIETSGLNPVSSLILEIAINIVDERFNVVNQIHLIIHHEPQALMSCSAWCKNKFKSVLEGGNGLFDDCVRSSTTYADANCILYNFFETFTRSKEKQSYRHQGSLYHRSPSIGYQPHLAYQYGREHKVVLAGSSVSFDRGFLLSHFPCLQPFIHYRILDISSILLACKMFSVGPLQLPRQRNAHRAHIDIAESTALLQALKQSFFDK
jgi:oligoribonuclease